jgi:hypothetical protein
MKYLRIFGFFLLFASLFGVLFLERTNAFDNNFRLNSPSSGGIKEQVPNQFREKYLKWKDELLITEFGRRQWEYYSANQQFSLIIIVSGDKEYAAKTSDYKWNDDGELVGATITLGKSLDKGFPNAIYYPVMNSLSLQSSSYEISGNILAATKFAHEIGHVNVTAQTKGDLFQRQNKLMAAYYKIFLKNGYNTSDQRLVELAGELGGMPIQIWADREYWGEANAMRYLAERAGKEKFYCSVFNQIKRNISDYAKNYEDRFELIDEIKLAATCQN